MSKKYLIWDLPLRLFHWLFVAAILVAWASSELGSDYIDYHMMSGYFIIGLLLFRVVWGFIGPKHARFRQFLPSFSSLVKYVQSLKKGEKIYAPGHNPLGSLMVVLMIVLTTLQATSGLFINDDVFSSGPYYGSISASTEQVMSFLHHNVFNVLLFAIFLHLFAIAYYLKVKKENLVLPMITGKKKADVVDQADAIPHSRLILAIVLAIAVTAFVYWLVVINAPVIEEFY